MKTIPGNTKQHFSVEECFKAIPGNIEQHALDREQISSAARKTIHGNTMMGFSHVTVQNNTQQNSAAKRNNSDITKTIPGN